MAGATGGQALERPHEPEEGPIVARIVHKVKTTLDKVKDELL